MARLSVGIFLVLVVCAAVVRADLPCSSVSKRCCEYSIRCLTAFGSEVFSFRNSDGGNWKLYGADTVTYDLPPDNSTITVENTCPKGLVRDCPLGYDYFPDVNSEGVNSCQKRDQLIVGGTSDYQYNPASITPFDTINDCIMTSVVMSYSVDYCLEPYFQALRHCLFEIGRKG